MTWNTVLTRWSCSNDWKDDPLADDFFKMKYVKSKSDTFYISFRRFRSMNYLIHRLIQDRWEFSTLDRLRLMYDRWDLREKINKVIRWRENMTDTILLNMYDRTWIASFTLWIDTKEKYRIWSRDFISESIGSIPLNHPRTNIISIPIDRKEINITLNKKSMMPFVSWIALLKFRHNFVEKKSSTTVSDNRCLQDSDEYIF